MKKAYIILIIVVAILTISFFVWYGPSQKSKIIVATTTSLYDTGLLDVVEKAFESKHPRYDISFISAGTGIALKYASQGDADLVLVHAPSKEHSFLKDGYGVNRRIIAYNFFLIIGPPEDPARIRGLGASGALIKLVKAGREGGAYWVSRGDESGTHTKEKALWKEAGFNPDELRKEPWYIEAGAGMGKTLLLANEKSAYTLSDSGTYLNYRQKNLIGLTVYIEESKELINVYSAIAVNPDKVEGVNFEGAMSFIEFLTSKEGQDVIGSFGVKTFGRPLFNPAVELLKKDEGEIAGWIKESAYLGGYECPPDFRK